MKNKKEWISWRCPTIGDPPSRVSGFSGYKDADVLGYSPTCSRHTAARYTKGLDSLRDQGEHDQAQKTGNGGGWFWKTGSVPPGNQGKDSWRRVPGESEQ